MCELHYATGATFFPRKTQMPRRRTKTVTCPECGFKLTYSAPKTVRKKSAKRVARGKTLAAKLPRDEYGRFKPLGSEDEFRRRPLSGRPKKRSRF